MMKGYLDDANGAVTTVSVTGLPASATGYQVYVYADGDNNNSACTSTYTISGAGITTTSINLTDAAGTNFSGTYKQANGTAGNYVVFTIPNVSGFTITAVPVLSAGSYRAPLNGIQIVP
jgi:hypothetical protein